MTDKEIIKALECCLKSPVDCDNCAYAKYPVRDCNTILKNDIADIINRQQAEIDRLNKENKILEYRSDVLLFHNKRMTNEIAELIVEKKVVEDNAIRQFAEKLKQKLTNLTKYYVGKRYFYLVSEKFIDKVVKEMVGADNDT